MNRLWFPISLLIFITIVLLVCGCAPPGQQADRGDAHAPRTMIKRDGFDVEVYRSGGNCVYVYGSYGIAVVQASAAGC